MSLTPPPFSSSRPAAQTPVKPLSALAMGMHTLAGVVMLALLLVAAFSVVAGMSLILLPQNPPPPVMGSAPAVATPGVAAKTLMVVAGAVIFTMVLIGVLHLYLHLWMIYLSLLPTSHAAQMDKAFWLVVHRFPGYQRVRKQYLPALPPLEK